MKKIFLSTIGFALIMSISSGTVSAKDPYRLSHAEIAELINNIYNEPIIKDIPELQDKVVVVDKNWNVVMEQPLDEILGKSNSSDERLLLKKSEFLMEYAGNSYYLLGR